MGLSAAVGLALAMLPAFDAAADEPCFDASSGFNGPLQPPIPLFDGVDHSLFGTYRDGTDWASSRAIVRMPIGKVLAKLRDYRNLKNMKKTRLVVRCVEEGADLGMCQLDVDVSVWALFKRISVTWTEEWAYWLVEGTPEEPAAVVANYQKIGGTSHIQHLCGSYSLRSFGPDATDLAFYDEVRARRRSAEDTRDMQLGILRNLRENRWISEDARDDPRVRYLPTDPSLKPMPEARRQRRSGKELW